MTGFQDRLRTLVADRGNLCVGVDPHPSLVRAWGYEPDLAGAERVCRELIAAVGDRVAAFKPQSAFFEAFGSAGVAVLARVLAEIAAAGALAILDVKRGDIGSTMAGYAHAHLSGLTDLSADAITLSPFLGFDALLPAIELAQRTERGVYVLCRTSNPEGTGVQLAEHGHHSVAQQVVDRARTINRAADCGVVGLVIGATLPKLDVDLTGFSGSILAPGIGAQGATISGLTSLFNAAVGQVLPTVSRAVMQVGPQAGRLRETVDALTGCQCAN